MKKTSIIISVIILIVIIVGVYFSINSSKSSLASLSQNSPDQNQQQTSTTNIQGMKIETLKEGSGAAAKTGDTVSVNYVGTLLDGTKFDSSLNPGRTPFQLTLPGQVIQGWNLGLVGMKVGEKRKLTIPPELAYGSQSPSPLIPANSTLVFEIDLLGLNQ